MSNKRLRQSISRPNRIGRMWIIAIITAGAASFAEVVGSQEVQPGVGDETVEEIIVTGSQVVRDGTRAPTPVTVVGAEYIEQRSAVNIADILNELPAFQLSLTPTTTSTLVQETGMNFVNLRGLGSERTLVLIEGFRHVPSADSGQFDLNLIPSILIERVEVVTGGASAAYGSDAVAGVVNIILKRDFEGFRTDMQHGRSDIGDFVETRVGVLAGTSFASNRGQATIAAEVYDNDGVGDAYTRRWGREEWGLVTNPNPSENGLPTRIIAPGVHQSTMTFGGVITGGPLRGIQFGPDGSPIPFVYGDLAGSQVMIGGDGAGQRFFHNVGLYPELERQVLYATTDYEISDSLEVFFDLERGRHRGIGDTPHPFDFGNDVIQRDNAFLPPSIADAMDANSVDSFAFGRYWSDFGGAHGDATTITWRAVGGIRGDLRNGWTWDAGVEYGETDLDQRITNAFILARKNEAIDAVFAPNGSIVCRSTLTDPDNGCKPVNLFGIGNSSSASFDYLRGVQQYLQDTSQLFVTANLRGDAFDLWAGPLSVAAGVAYREEEVDGTADQLGLANSFAFGNYKPLSGSYDVSEIYLEFLTPLTSDSAFAESLNLNGAIRYTDYSTSGGVTTGKLGVTWQIVPDLRLRISQSRDIRAANIGELFNPLQAVSPQLIIDPFRDNFTKFVTSNVSGNPNLQPEEAETLTAGIIFQPSWADGLRFSLDYFDIEIDDAISSLAAQDIVDRCFRGETQLCSLIRRGSDGFIAQIDRSSINIATSNISGLDIEFAYGFPVLNGDLFTRLFATRILEYEQSNGSIVTSLKGQTNAGVPEWAATAVVGYSRERFSATAQGRYFSDGSFNNNFVEGVDINDNTLPSAFYTNLTLSYGFGPPDDTTKYELFATVNNLFDRDPPPMPGQIQPTNGLAAGPYDVIGRAYRAGVRLRF